MKRRSLLGALGTGAVIGTSGCIGILEEQCEEIFVLTEKPIFEDSVTVPSNSKWKHQFPTEEDMEIHIELESNKPIQTEVIGESGSVIFKDSSKTIKDTFTAPKLGVSTIKLQVEGDSSTTASVDLFTRVKDDYMYCGPPENFADKENQTK